MSNQLEEWVFVLKPLGSMHLGLHGDMGQVADRVHSDTLWSALVTAAAGNPHSDDAEWLRNGVLLSSSFPVCTEAETPLLFLPRLFVGPAVPITEDTTAQERASSDKEWKSVAFVSESVLARLIRGELIKIVRVTNGEGRSDCQGSAIGIGSCLLAPTECPAQWDPLPQWLIAARSVASNTVDRLTSAADTFIRTDFEVNLRAGMRWGVLARLYTENVERFLSLLERVGGYGVGGERSIGRGQFTVEQPLARGPVPTSSPGRYVTLSLYHPTRSEVDAGVLDRPAAYQLMRRSGWVGTTDVRRKSVRMLKEGSLLNISAGLSERTSLGDIVDVTPNNTEPGKCSHSVWRFGRAFLWRLPEPAEVGHA
jgi:CRISPR type III-A-associated RAMP protein Csm4